MKEDMILQAQVDEVLTVNTALLEQGRENRETYDALLNAMSMAFGAEYIASRILALGLTTKEDKKMQYNIMCEDLETGVSERLDWTNDYEEALRWRQEYIEDSERMGIGDNYHYWIEEVEVDD